MKKLLEKRGKKAAMELSIGTIVILVLAMTMLILGMVLIRTIMCTGIVITEELEGSVRKEITDLFGAQEYGVRCMGSGGTEYELGGGGRRGIYCIVNVREETRYKLETEFESLSGIPTEIVESWVMDSGWEGTVSPARDEAAPILMLNIPSDVDYTTLRLRIQETNLDTGSERTHTSYIDIRHVGRFTATIC